MINNTNSSSNPRQNSRKPNRFLIKKDIYPPLDAKKTISGTAQLTFKDIIKPKTDTKFPLFSESIDNNNQYKESNMLIKTQQTLLKKEIDQRPNSKIGEIDVEKLAQKCDHDMNNYVNKAKYGDLQRKYELLLKQNEELKIRNKRLEHDCYKENTRNFEISEENERLKERLAELEAQNQNLLNAQKTKKVSDQLSSIEETKIDENELSSLKLVLRYEAENMLMHRLSQLAALQMIYERPEPVPTHDINNLDNINPDNMTYEELLQLEERMGKVSRGLSVEEIKKLPKRIYKKKLGESEEICSICFVEMETGIKVRKLSCCHEYHSKCIKKWLLNEKICPICKKEVHS